MTIKIVDVLKEFISRMFPTNSFLSCQLKLLTHWPSYVSYWTKQKLVRQQFFQHQVDFDSNIWIQLISSRVQNKFSLNFLSLLTKRSLFLLFLDVAFYKPNINAMITHYHPDGWEACLYKVTRRHEVAQTYARLRAP